LDISLNTNHPALAKVITFWFKTTWPSCLDDPEAPLRGEAKDIIDLDRKSWLVKWHILEGYYTKLI